jgi:DNA repair photolyase
LDLATYKHSISVTSQLYFCSAPIRIDAYDTCQFACVYCFSRSRSRRAASDGVHAANARSLQQRFDRIRNGIVQSALDEFLLRRVPIQLGGLQDPFTPMEAENGVTLAILKVLAAENYPTLISTKGNVFLQDPYLEVLQRMNLVFRISAAGVSESLRPSIDRRADGFERVLQKIAALREKGIKVALRIQPVIPSFEDEALQMTTAAANAGVHQVSFEYLKLPSEEIRHAMAGMRTKAGGNLLDWMAEMGIKKLGPDWSLKPEAKLPFVKRARAHCHDLGIRFGAGDTEFIPWSDGNGCCGSSDLVLNANQFDTNFVGAIRQAVNSPDRAVRFETLAQRWLPDFSVGNYLDYRRRVPIEERDVQSDWLPMLKRRWNGGKSPYSPSFFYGVDDTGKTDSLGFRIYDASSLASALAQAT